jgi:hypothetical protein
MENRADAMFMELLETLTAQGQHVSPNPSSSYAPKMFAEHPDSAGVTYEQFKAAMQRLLKARKVRIETTVHRRSKGQDWRS